MEKIYKNKPVIDKNGRYSMEQIELDSIKTVITELTEPQLKDLLAAKTKEQLLKEIIGDSIEINFNEFMVHYLGWKLEDHKSGQKLKDVIKKMGL